MANTNLKPVNRDLNQLHDLLIATNEKLSDSLNGITDPDLARGVVTEMREVVHRIDLVQSLLFSASSNRITAAVAKVEQANAALTAALKSITDLTTLVKHVAGLLALVD